MKNELIKHEEIPQKNQNERENLPDVHGEKVNENYRILKKGALKYIINNDGKIVSEGYHEFDIFKHDNVIALIGRKGAMQNLLKTPQNLDDFFEESPEDFHDIYFDDSLGLMIVSTGAMNYVLDMQTGQKISKGYHEIVKRGDKLYGQIGATEEEIEFIASKQIPNTNQIENNNQ
ncbi:hypothetical protein KAU09_02545 [Candidatus Parcubacteria bacterium]|nr:hypothetical protein [Candidatus Parcubacteria bacterium]